MKTLVICEKNNAAKRISTILSGGNRQFLKRGRLSYYGFETGEGEFYVIGLRGHIITLDYPTKYNNWKAIEPSELVWKEPYKREHAHDIAGLLKDLIPKVQRIIIATDFDREGELIGMESVEILGGKLPGIELKRAKFSALTKWEIERAFGDLVDVDINLARAGETRQHIDLVWGASLTRFISLASMQTGRDFLSVGRVQSPTLALLVDREKEIKSFEPVPYWEIHADLEKNGDAFQAEHAEGRFDDRDAAQKAFIKARVCIKAKVAGASKIEREDRPPVPYSTTLFLADATSKLRISASKVMSLAEDLYTEGWISYPRTDNTVYPPSIGLKSILERLKESSFKKEAEELLKQGKLMPTRGRVSTTDHPPIYPVRGTTHTHLRGERWKVYELIVRRFLATLAPNCVVEERSASFDLKGEPFKARGLKVMSPGWRKYFPHYPVKEVHIPELKRGDMVEVKKVFMEDKETKPPRRYSQASLIKEMERLMLGTKSTRHEIIQKLVDRGYTEQGMIPTATGFAVVEALESYAERVTKSEMTSTLEKDMSRIAEGEIKMKDVITESRQMLEQVFVELNKNRDEIGKAIQTALNSENNLGKCGNCGKDLLIRRSRRGKRFAGCSGYPSCRNTFPLPQRGKIIPTDMNCKDCQSPVIKVIEKGQKPWITCINMQCPGKNQNNNKKK